MIRATRHPYAHLPQDDKNHRPLSGSLPSVRLLCIEIAFRRAYDTDNGSEKVD
jgi:hypothetical protein